MPGLVVLYDLQPGNRAGLILQLLWITCSVSKLEKNVTYESEHIVKER